ncbi:uncharacterized protein LOC126033866 isoform X2 [Accipiter gentilis]|uniref:uncharacterized protein LOC126033866 isoform X2 n=1 Tax=Astur gentilis TaxID=8957 RepID=UPI0021107D34|nr:uncharacterized protein LOC126033866 isoform X2 [Accipiter gentilis]
MITRCRGACQHFTGRDPDRIVLPCSLTQWNLVYPQVSVLQGALAEFAGTLAGREVLHALPILPAQQVAKHPDDGRTIFNDTSSKTSKAVCVWREDGTVRGDLERMVAQRHFTSTEEKGPYLLVRVCDYQTRQWDRPFELRCLGRGVFSLQIAVILSWLVTPCVSATNFWQWMQNQLEGPMCIRMTSVSEPINTCLYGIRLSETELKTLCTNKCQQKNQNRSQPGIWMPQTGSNRSTLICSDCYTSNPAEPPGPERALERKRLRGNHIVLCVFLRTEPNSPALTVSGLTQNETTAVECQQATRK